MVLHRLHRLYDRAFKASPGSTVAVTNALLKALGDLMAQLLPSLTSSAAPHAFSWDARRSVRFIAFGFATGPLIGKWHEALEHYVPLVPPLRPMTLSPTPLPFAALSPVVSEHSRSPYTSFSLNGTPKSPKSPSPRPPGSRQIDPKRMALFQAFQLTKRVLADQLIWAPLYVTSFIVVMALLEGLSWSAALERFDRLFWPILSTNWKVWPLIQLINFRLVPLQYRVAWQASCGVIWTVFLSFATHSADPSHMSSMPTALAAAAAHTDPERVLDLAGADARQVDDRLRGLVNGLGKRLRPDGDGAEHAIIDRPGSDNDGVWD